MIRIGQGGSIVNVEPSRPRRDPGHICYGSSKAALAEHHPGVRVELGGTASG